MNQLPERDETKPAEAQGLFRKFIVERVDNSPKHSSCEYFVLDVTHDEFAKTALRAYATACQSTHPQLALDIIRKYELWE